MATGKTEAAVVWEISPGSPAAQAGLRPGDELLRLNGVRLTDYIQYRYLAASSRLRLDIRRGSEELTITLRKRMDEDPGIRFTSDIFDGLRTCRNHCRFCFVDQMPGGLRRSLYVKDDDYRLSFLYGNFITLTNLSEADRSRIMADRLSPLYVSVHSTSPELRRVLMGSPRAGDILRQLAAFVEAGIEIHAQVVLIPGLNDGAELARTVRDLHSLGPNLKTLAIVPAGRTRYRRDPWRAWDSVGARRLLELVDRWREEFAREEGEWIFPADEFYLLAEKPWPPAEVYGDFPQWGNGVGMLARLVEEIATASLPTEPLPPTTILTGTMMAPVFQQIFQRIPELAHADIEVRGVPNRLFGEEVTVAGLLGGEEVAAATDTVAPGRRILVPGSAVTEGLFLDDWPWAEIVRRTGGRAVLVRPNGMELLRALQGG